ncbi:MAG: hypothetical protein HY925_00140 [Elusimicrobia bacterium]|nr:hypothetical protein [Elusimicrobiota bacterium]
MDPLRLIVAFALAVLPVVWWLWKDARDRDPSVLWPLLAPGLKFSFSGPPPELKGDWNGRPAALTMEGGRTVASVRHSPGKRVRLELGARADVERDAGMVVPDRVEFPEDRAFSETFLVRATPEDFGRLVVDASFRARLAALPGVRILASGGRVDVSVPDPRTEDQFRALLDVAAAIAEAADHAA